MVKNIGKAVLRIRDVYPRSRIGFFPSRILDPELTKSRIRIRKKEFKYFWTKKLVLSSRKNYLGRSSRSRIFFYPGFRIQGSKKHRTRIADPKHWLKALERLEFRTRTGRARTENLVVGKYLAGWCCRLQDQQYEVALKYTADLTLRRTQTGSKPEIVS
jgi:hypothetical protein